MNRFVIFSVLTFSIVLSASEDKINNILNGNDVIKDVTMSQSDGITQTQVQFEQIEYQEVIDETYLQANNTKSKLK